MSFILDALKKSENERQSNAPPEFATVPAGPDSPGAPRWLWGLGGLLLINLVVVVALLTRDAPPQVAATDVDAARPPKPAAATPQSRPADAFAERLEEARSKLPERSAGTSMPIDDTSVSTEPARRDSRPAVSASGANSIALLPSLDELRLNGELDLPDMHVDIHVWSDNAQERFVFINMDKYRERDTMSAGPLVTEITRDGVVLEYRGRRFMLSRD